MPHDSSYRDIAHCHCGIHRSAIPGVFLVLRRMSMMADAITHTVFLGIVLAFFMTEDLNSISTVGATLVGVGTVWLYRNDTQYGTLSTKMRLSASSSLFYSLSPSFLVSLYSGNAHLDVDTALLGEIAFAPFDRWIVNGTDLGPVSLWISRRGAHQFNFSHAILQGIAIIYL